MFLHAKGRACGGASTSLSSSIRTVTVGSGFSPDLLTSFCKEKERSRAPRSNPGYRRWGFPPRPENKLLDQMLDSSSWRTLSTSFFTEAKLRDAVNGRNGLRYHRKWEQYAPFLNRRRSKSHLYFSSEEDCIGSRHQTGKKIAAK